MLIHARRAMQYVEGRSFNDFCSEPMLRDAVERVVQVVGEAASNVSQVFRKAHPEIPWRPIIATRHILVHEYGEVDPAKVWRVATIYVPELVVLLEPLIPPSPTDPEPETT